MDGSFSTGCFISKRFEPRKRGVIQDFVPPLSPTTDVKRVPREGPIADRDTERDAILVLLSYLGDKSIVPRLMALVDDRNVTDDFKLKLISVIHEFDPRQDTETLLDHLRNPFKAIQQSHRQHVQRLSSPFELSLWLEIAAQVSVDNSSLS